MTSVRTLSTHTNMRDAYAAASALSDAYHKAHKKRETVSITITSHSPSYAKGKRLKTAVEECEVRVNWDPASGTGQAGRVVRDPLTP